MLSRHDLMTSDQRNKDRIEAGKFNIIYADPAWRFVNWSMKELAQRGEKWARRNGRSPYDVMDTSDICALDVPALSAKDSVLFMWATYPKLAEALKVISAWDFIFKTVGFTWVKQNPSGVGFHLGMGYHSRGNPEICLLATRGKGLQRVDNAVPNLIISPVREHSRKPDEARNRIERLYGDVPRVELFARQRTPGWAIWGNEAPGGSDIVLSGEFPQMAAA